MKTRSVPQGLGFVFACLTLFAISACSERITSAPARLSADPDHARDDVLVALQCDAQVAVLSVSCKAPSVANASGVSRDIIGGQNAYVRMDATNVSYNGGTELYQFDATVQNLMNEAIGTPNGTVVDDAGITVFMDQGLTATTGSGSMSVLNEDGIGTFTGSNQEFFRYPQLLVKDQVSAPKTWQFQIPTSVTSFTFYVYLSVRSSRCSWSMRSSPIREVRSPTRMASGSSSTTPEPAPSICRISSLQTPMRADANPIT